MLGEARGGELLLLIMTINVVGARRETGPWQSALALAPDQTQQDKLKP